MLLGPFGKSAWEAIRLVHRVVPWYKAFSFKGHVPRWSSFSGWQALPIRFDF